jgi:hypothetical protein
MKTKNSFIWERVFSSTGPVTIAAGAPVKYSKECKCYFVQPSFFSEDSILKHDATYHGCRVDLQNVVFEEGETPPHP